MLLFLYHIGAPNPSAAAVSIISAQARGSAAAALEYDTTVRQHLFQAGAIIKPLVGAPTPTVTEYHACSACTLITTACYSNAPESNPVRPAAGTPPRHYTDAPPPAPVVTDDSGALSHDDDEDGDDDEPSRRARAKPPRLIPPKFCMLCMARACTWSSSNADAVATSPVNNAPSLKRTRSNDRSPSVSPSTRQSRSTLRIDNRSVANQLVREMQYATIHHALTINQRDRADDVVGAREHDAAQHKRHRSKLDVHAIHQGRYLRQNAGKDTLLIGPRTERKKGTSDELVRVCNNERHWHTDSKLGRHWERCCRYITKKPELINDISMSHFLAKTFFFLHLS